MLLQAYYTALTMLAYACFMLALAADQTALKTLQSPKWKKNHVLMFCV